MKNSTKIILIIAACTLSFGIVLCTIGIIFGAPIKQVITLENGWTYSFHYQHGYINDFNDSNQYSIDTNAIDSVNIDWISGDVEVIPYDGDEIQLIEESHEKITSKSCLRYGISHGTLQVDFCKDDGAFGISKALKVKIPRELASDIDCLAIDSISSDCTVKNITADSLDFDTTSGSLKGKNITADTMDIDTISGDIDITFKNCPQELDIDSTSGDTNIYIPNSSNFMVEFDSVSGDFNTDFTTVNSDEVYIVGGGQCEFTVDTISGDFNVRKKIGTR